MTKKHADDHAHGRGEEDADDRKARRKRKEQRRRISRGRVSAVVDDEDLDLRQAEQDDDANADLSLQIVEKAENRLRRKKSGRGYDDDKAPTVTPPVHDSDAQDSMDEDDFVKRRRTRSNYVLPETRGKEPASRSETPEEGELQEDGDGNLVLATDLRASENSTDGKAKKKKKKKKKDKKKGGNIVAEGIPEKEVVIEVEDGVADESMVMRKLLRGPRYFDPPEDQGGESCFNCGKVGHIAATCPEGPRIKPCYVCGEFVHDGRDCPKKTECYVCGKMGHIARNCPNKGLRTTSAREVDSVCLLCGREGHDTSTCYYSYDSRDLEQVQCYICKKFGHLCCVAVVDTSPHPLSCFLCGEMGHSGTGCSRRNPRERERPSLCFTCGEEGHYARGCIKGRGSRTRPSWPQDGETLAANELTSYTYKSRSDGRVPHWMDLQQRENRWSFSQRVKAEDRWTGSRTPKDYERADDAPRVDVSNQDSDYMGPLDKFIDPLKDGYHSRRRKRWTPTVGR